MFRLLHYDGRDDVFGIATRYGLDGPGMVIMVGKRFFVPSRSAPRPTRSPVQWIPFLF